jgi:hypothetical protein
MEKLLSLFKLNDNHKKIIEQAKPWTDTNFPHDHSVIKDIEGVTGWIRASELFKKREKVYESLCADDIEQGLLGDCYLLAAIAALAEFPGRVQKLFLQQERNEAGCYVVKLFVSGQYVNVTVDDYFPIDAYKRLAFAGSKNQELWVMLLEKAWAKLHGDFSVIEGGDSRESIAAITGAPAEYYKHKDLSTDELWKLISAADAANCVMCTGASSDTKGVVRSHAYTLINVHEFNHKGENVRLVQIRNPWACTEWTGAWSDNDPRWTPELRKKLNHRAVDDGMFYMSFNDFAEVYIHTFIGRSKDEYHHSSLGIQGDKAFAMFKVRKLAKGFVSAYEITKRLGETLVPGYAIAQMRFDLYKFDEEKKQLIALKATYNNAIGQANLEVELDVGLYVVSAKYEKSTKIPYVTFCSYTDERFMFVELKINNVSEITYEKLKETFKTLKTVYKTKDSPQRRFAGAFRCCLAGHRLRWTEKPYDKDKTYLCDNCRRKYEFMDGCWACQECKYEICPKCRPKHIGRTGKEDKKDKVQCNNGHSMKFKASTDPEEVYLCDKCGKAYYGIVARWECEPCRMDLCRVCIPPPVGFKEEEIPEIDTCYNGHKLQFVMAETRKGMYECSLCLKIGDTHNGRWTCFECGVNLCHICKPAKEAKEGLLSAPTKTITCDKGHSLAFSCSPPEPGYGFYCDKCEGNVAKDNWRWTCKDCGFDVCIKCRPEPEGRRDLICPNMHKLMYTTLPQETATYTRCDCCYKAFKFANGAFCCLPCD